MILRSVPTPDMGWRVPIIAVLMGLFLPALVGMGTLYFVDAQLSGLPKDGSARSFEQHIGFVAAALTASPIIGWMIIPLAVPTLRLMAQTGWAGVCSAMALAVVLGVPLVHWMLNGDLTTEDSSLVPHIIIALGLQGLTGWTVMRAFIRPPA